jgi:DNA-directed RNA polymerase specialized sigma24 family protein
MLPGTGMSAGDLVADTIANLITSGRWRQSSPSGDLFPLAFRMMYNDFLDLIDREEYKRTLITNSIDGDHNPQDLENLPSSSAGMETAEAVSLVNSLERLLGHDKRLKAYLEVWLIEGLESRADIAYALGISEQEVTNIRRRLTYKISLLERVFANVRPHSRKKV